MKTDTIFSVARPPATLDVFTAIGHPRRRQIVQLLATGDKAVGELVSELAASQSTVSEHLAHLRAAGVVSGHPRGRERLYHLEKAPLQQVSAWIDHLDAFWDERIDKLRHVLDDLQGEEPR